MCSTCFKTLFVKVIRQYTLLHITNTLLCTIKSNTCCQPILLDLSSAFDTLYSNMLLSRVIMMGIYGLALIWFIYDN